MPRQQSKIKYRRGFKKWSDEMAVKMRSKLGLLSHAPLCAFDLCKILDVPVFNPNQIENLSVEHLDNLLNEGSSFWSAASIPLNNGKYIIIHNPTHNPARQQSNLMHELAHIICDHKIPQEKNNTGLSGFLRNYDADHENEAEWFGACLQLPREALLWALKRKMNQKEISSYFNASEEMVRYRINITGVKRQLSYMYK